MIKRFLKFTGIPKKIVEVYMNRQYKKMIKGLPIKNPKRVLDVGGSSGIFAKNFRKFIEVNEYFLLDIDENKLEEGKEKNQGIIFLKGDVQNLPFPAKSFDLVICKDVLHHCENPSKGVSEIKRVGKKYIIIEARRGDRWLDHFLKEHNHLTEKKFKEIIKPKNFSYLDILWPKLKYMVFLVFFPRIPPSKKAFMVGYN